MTAIITGAAIVKNMHASDTAAISHCKLLYTEVSMRMKRMTIMTRRAWVWAVFSVVLSARCSCYDDN